MTERTGIAMMKQFGIAKFNRTLKRGGSIVLSAAMLLGANGLFTFAEEAETGSQTEVQDMQTALEMIDMTRWQYNAEDDVYYQVGIAYCADPADPTYETMGIFIPGAYMTGTDNGNGTYTCTVNTGGSAGNYTAETAPYVIPVNTPGYSACAAPTGYSNVSQYTDAGFIYVYAGCRGRDQGAPAIWEMQRQAVCLSPEPMKHPRII